MLDHVALHILAGRRCFLQYVNIVLFSSFSYVNIMLTKKHQMMQNS
jgi:hypothetical protein